MNLVPNVLDRVLTDELVLYIVRIRYHWGYLSLDVQVPLAPLHSEHSFGRQRLQQPGDRLLQLVVVRTLHRDDRLELRRKQEES